MQKWLILDRDGVINADSDHFIKSPAEWQPLPGSLEAIARLHQAGFSVVVISNQSGVARGLFSLDTLRKINNKMRQAVTEAGGQIEKIYFCPHGPDDNCQCRKPLPGLFLQAAEEQGFDLSTVYAVGDSVRDLDAAISAGAQPILVKTGKGPRSLAHIDSEPADSYLHQVPQYADLAAFADTLLCNE